MEFLKLQRPSWVVVTMKMTAAISRNTGSENLGTPSCPTITRHLRAEAHADSWERLALGVLAAVLIGTLAHQLWSAQQAVTRWAPLAGSAKPMLTARS